MCLCDSGYICYCNKLLIGSKIHKDQIQECMEKSKEVVHINTCDISLSLSILFHINFLSLSNFQILLVFIILFYCFFLLLLKNLVDEDRYVTICFLLKVSYF